MENKQRKSWINWTIFLITVVVVFVLGMLATTITERRIEREYVYEPRVQIAEWEPRNEVWGENFPAQYQSHQETSDTGFHSKYNGNAMIDMLVENPRMVVLWAGYAFSKEYNQGRGHYYAIKDLRHILRTGAPEIEEPEPMPATCWTCKSSDVPRLMNEVGITEFYRGKWSRWGEEVVNSVGCADCHDHETMDLRISRPALIEAFENRGMDITQATHQEMRSLVCAQCHVEYYFNNNLPGKEGVAYLKFPWDKGLEVEQVLEYYDEIEFSDWTHQLSRAPMLKAQHPGYETWYSGTHAERGVTCADCHMPYMSEGGQKYSDHHMQSPLNNVSNSCQVCHNESEEDLIRWVYDKQTKVNQQRDELEKVLVRAHVEAKHAWDHGATQSQMQDVLHLIRHAQFRWDYATQAHGASFHNSLESLRMISAGIERAQEARIKLTRIISELGAGYPVPYPDISTKPRAQEYIGLPMEQLRRNKKLFLEEIVPQWIRAAQEREEQWEVVYY
ncbi:MAG: ammonia-forming cytochrome c nitrite reductase [Bacteroidota bacterium]